jgi:hypothetical protein
VRRVVRITVRRDLDASSVDDDPGAGAGLPARTTRSSSAAGRRVEAELLDGELVGVGGLAHLRRGRHVAQRGHDVDEQARPDLREPSRSSLRSARDRSAPPRARTPVRCRALLDLHDATPVVGRRPASPARRRGPAPARQQRVVHVHEAVSARSGGTVASSAGGSSCPNATTTPALRVGAGDVVDDLAGPLG